MLQKLGPRLDTLVQGYPTQFWLIFWGGMISAVGGSMVWPFLTIYLRQRLEVPLTTVTLLLTINSIFGLVFAFIAGPVADRLGRKPVMLTNLFSTSVVFASMSLAGSLAGWAALMAAFGAAGPLYRVGSDAMVADLVEPGRRPGGYALLRMINNLGISIGPAVGGFIAAATYTIVFYTAAATHLIYGLIVLLFVRESMPKAQETSFSNTPVEQVKPDAGYSRLAQDRPFLVFCGLNSLSSMAYMILMVLLPVYAKENFGILESQYGFIMASNAIMVVLFQYVVTLITKRYPYIWMMAVGSLFIALGAASVALGSTFWGFLTSMVVLTIGEMIAHPTASVLTAQLAPLEMRGRYMSILGLTYGTALGIGPVLGGLLNDQISPVAIWYGAGLIGLFATLGFAVFASKIRGRPSLQPSS